MDKQKTESVGQADEHETGGTTYTDNPSSGFEDRVSILALQTVFLTHGAVIGVALGHIALGLFIGIVASVLLDFSLGSNSLIWSIMRYAGAKVCSAVTSLAHAMAGAISRKGAPASSRLANTRCQFPH